jgi:L-ascorbate metabolism protein UlaG (beta-lactamase superfamily)
VFRKSKAEEIVRLFALQPAENEIAFMYLGGSGAIVRTSNRDVMIDPAGFLKNDEVKALNGINLLLFTHNHVDHFNAGKTVDIFKVTGTAILAEPKVANKLKDKIPADKLTSASSGQTYTFADMSVKAVAGIHHGPIILYQVKIGPLTLFHAGDSGYVNVMNYASEVAFLPTGRMSRTASPENAYKMASELKPNVAIAIHGSEGQKKEFEKKVKEKMPETTVIIIKPYVSRIVTVRKKA